MAAVDFFLKIEGIEGESADHKHKGEIDVSSWSWGESQTGTMHVSGGGGAGKVRMQDFQVIANHSKASPKLLLACLSGEHIKSAVLSCRKAGKEQQEYLKFTLSDVMLTSFTHAGKSATDPSEQVGISFAKIEMEYKEQKSDGTLGGTTKAGWDVKHNKKV